MKSRLFVIGLCALLANCTNGQVECQAEERTDIELRFPEEVELINLANEEWMKILDPQEFHVLREHGTERAFTGKYWKHKGEGYYVCSACQLPLFHSETKYKSGTGWPSYYQPVSNAYVKEIKDESFGMSRTEVVCARCSGHLGHVFTDGPQPTGLRYCINSVSLDFVESDKEP